MLCGNGAFTYDVGLGEVTAHRLMDPQVALEILREVRAELPDVVFALESVRGSAREEGFVRAESDRVGEWRVGPVEELMGHPPGKILVRHPGYAVDELHRRVAAVVGLRAEVSHSGAVGLTEIGGAGVTKGVALASWCDEQGVPAEAVWAFGDMPNDLPMLTWAGRSFAVANAHPDVRAAATDGCASNDDDGVARVLERTLEAG